MLKLACFDLDGTLTREIHSVMLLCILNDQLEQLLEIEKLEHDGSLHWVEADYHKAALIKGLPVVGLVEGFINNMKSLQNIVPTIAALKKCGMSCIVITAGPKQVAEIVKDLWGFDAAYGSDYEVMDGVFTGRIIEHVGDKGKLDCLLTHCQNNGLSPKDCIAIGDGSSDIPLFEGCGYSLALNAASVAKQKAACFVDTNDLADILPYISKDQV